MSTSKHRNRWDNDEYVFINVGFNTTIVLVRTHNAARRVWCSSHSVYYYTVRIVVLTLAVALLSFVGTFASAVIASKRNVSIFPNMSFFFVAFAVQQQRHETLQLDKERCVLILCSLCVRSASYRDDNTSADWQISKSSSLTRDWLTLSFCLPIPVTWVQIPVTWVQIPVTWVCSLDWP